MSTKYKHGDHVPTEVLAKRLDELADVVGQPGEERDRELTRRVPAELDRDADLVLLEASTRLLKMEAEVARLTRQVCEVAGEADWADHIAETSREELEEVGGENYSLKQERDAALEQVVYWRERALEVEAERDSLQRLASRRAEQRDELLADLGRLRTAAFEVCNEWCDTHESVSRPVFDAMLESTGNRAGSGLPIDWLAEAALGLKTKGLAE